MNINFKNTDLEYLYNQVLEDINGENNDPCNFFKLSIDKYFAITLACKHKYHVECLLNSLKNNNKECPYCRDCININYYKSQCCKILKTGNQCKKKIYNDEKLCLVHIKTENKCINDNDKKITDIKNKIYRKRNQICKLHDDINNLKVELASVKNCII